MHTYSLNTLLVTFKEHVQLKVGVSQLENLRGKGANLSRFSAALIMATV